MMTGTPRRLSSGTAQNASLTKRLKSSGGSTLCRSCHSTLRRTRCRLGVPSARSKSLRFVFDIVEIVREPGLAEKIIELPQLFCGFLGERLVSDQDQPVGVLTPERFAQRIDREADEPIARSPAG